MAEARTLTCWAEFESELARLQAKRDEFDWSLSAKSPLLFRGRSNADWPLSTTLERYTTKIVDFDEYLRTISATAPAVESLTNKEWRVPDYSDLAEWARKSSSPWLSSLPAYPYLVYLRHHGFPSPLLDWSASPYVAAFFAFRTRSASPVAIYAYLETTGQGKSSMGSEPMIHTEGPYVTTHARHVLQQCQYTICTRFIDERLFVAKHDDVFQRNDSRQDLLWKLVLPAEERVNVLRRLDMYNLNAFSLFQTEDALLETMALREIDFDE